MANPEKTEAIIMKSLKWRDSSKIVTVFSEQNGLIKVIAHGASREKSPFRGLLEALNLVEAVIFISDNRSLQILKEISLINDFPDIKTDFVRTAYAFSILELVDHVFHEGQSDPVFFQFLIRMFLNMGSSNVPEIIWCYFLLKIASYLGFKPDFGCCAGCERQDMEQSCFAFGDGVLYCKECLTSEGPVRMFKQVERQFLEDLQKTNHKRIGLERYPQKPDFDFSGFLLDYLNHHIGHPLEIKSLELLK